MKRQAMGLAVGAMLALGTAGAIAAVTADDTVHACRLKRHGTVRIPDPGKTCKRTETAVNWAVQGPAGPTGAAGAAGPAGPAGPKGPKGDPGGVASIGAIVGTPCTTFDGDAGTISVDVGPTDLLLIQCDASGGDGGDTGDGGGSAAPGSLVINEVDYDQVGSDTAGFVEIKNTSNAAVSLEGVVLVFVNGGDSTEYDRSVLTGTLAAGAYLVVSKDAQNGAPDGVALIDTVHKTLLDALSYEGPISAATIDGQTYSLVEGTVLPATVADSNTVDGTLIRTPDGRDTNNAATDWAFTTTPTPGAANILTAPTP